MSIERRPLFSCITIRLRMYRNKHVTLSVCLIEQNVFFRCSGLRVKTSHRQGLAVTDERKTTHEKLHANVSVSFPIFK